MADINVENNFGSMVLFIPKTWNVEFHTKASFAGVREQGMSEAQDTPILRIYGEVSFGDLLIVYIWSVILELSYHAFRYKLTNVLLQNLSFCFAKKFTHSSGKATAGFAVACFSF